MQLVLGGREFKVKGEDYNNETLVMDEKSIIYIENRDRGTFLVTSGGNFLIDENFGRMCTFLEELDNGFVRSHQSFMVNGNFVVSYDERRVVLISGKKRFEVYTSRRRFKGLREKMSEIEGKYCNKMKMGV